MKEYKYILSLNKRLHDTEKNRILSFIDTYMDISYIEIEELGKFTRNLRCPKCLEPLNLKTSRNTYRKLKRKMTLATCESCNWFIRIIRVVK